MTVYGNLYILAFALVLSLIGFDLVMSMDPHWYSTLFGAYTFVKAFYVGLGAVIILASLLHLHPKVDFLLPPSSFHDIGKLFFAFCMLWGDFFYVQLVVIWYGNIPEETAYMIQRTQTRAMECPGMDGFCDRVHSSLSDSDQQKNQDTSQGHDRYLHRWSLSASGWSII